uniref:Uncharacterized protein MANES_01G043200 n=1 Tax=Rhizophora mucronata TaxID=61149 RepID=A0A2P2LCD9_RHIMU
MGEAAVNGIQEELEERIEEVREEKTESETAGENADNNENKEKKRKKMEGGAASGLLRLFPKMALRVLLVESDDSTRQIIAALLRKCSYRVAAVPNGLKAWEILKRRPHNVDLILAEVDLPSISGYALLTLIMEHETCKNVPVIMMSSEDSISTVYKCMLRGAADYLVKPIRRNELRNLWQHVWRRQSSLVAGNCPQDESVGQDNIEATSGNNGINNHSRGDIACSQRSKRYIEKENDDQDSAHSGQGEFWSNDLKMRRDDVHSKVRKKLLVHERGAEGSAMAVCNNVNKIAVDKGIEVGHERSNANVACEAVGDNGILVPSCREAIDFMGTCINQNVSSNPVKSKFDSSSQSNLSLNRCHPSGFDIELMEERHNIGRSHASAFMPYSSRTLEPQGSTLASVCNQKESVADSERNLSNNVSFCHSNYPDSALGTQRKVVSLATGQTKENAASCHQRRVFEFPIQIPMQGLTFNTLYTSYGSVYSPLSCKQSSSSQMPSPVSACQQDTQFKVNSFHQSNFESDPAKPHDQIGQNASEFTNCTSQKQDYKLDCLDKQGHISPATDQSANSSFCNGATSHLNSRGYGSTFGSNGNVDQAAIIRAVAESKNDLTDTTNSHRSIQREAALTKFRLKRKERCYEKKVRYESRKKLAEQRLRVKGQFVRQARIDPACAETG